MDPCIGLGGSGQRLSVLQKEKWNEKKEELNRNSFYSISFNFLLVVSHSGYYKARLLSTSLLHGLVSREVNYKYVNIHFM